MNWQERAEYVLGEIQYALDNPGHLNADIRCYIRESAERIAMLEAALAQAVKGAGINIQFVDAGFTGEYWVRHRGKDVVMMGDSDVMGLAYHYPTLARWLKEQQEKP